MTTLMRHGEGQRAHEERLSVLRLHPGGRSQQSQQRLRTEAYLALQELIQTLDADDFVRLASEALCRCLQPGVSQEDR